MNFRLLLAWAWIPGFVKRRQLRRLIRGTAEAFGVPSPELAGKSYRECLQLFAALTASASAEVSRRDAVGPGGEGDAVRESGGSDATAARVRARLRGVGRAAGDEARLMLGIASRAQGMKAARLVYRMLGIEFDGRADGAIVFRSCAFSRGYSPATCALVSGLDEGLLAGLVGEGWLEFRSRITEGCARCEATFHFEAGQQ